MGYPQALSTLPSTLQESFVTAHTDVETPTVREGFAGSKAQSLGQSNRSSYETVQAETRTVELEESDEPRKASRLRRWCLTVLLAVYYVTL